MANYIIGITGFAGSGKNSIANVIHQTFPEETEIMSFGSAVKDVCSVLFDWPRDLLEGDTDKSREFRETEDDYWTKMLGQDWTPRKAMQFVGTDLIRNQLSDSFWLDLAMKKIDKSDKIVIIPDVRFRNEINCIQKKGGIIIRAQLGENPEWFDKIAEINEKIPDLMENKQLDKVLLCLSEIKRIIPQNMHNSEYEWIGYDFPHRIIKCDVKGLDLLKNKVINSGILNFIKNRIDFSKKS
jgi:hypothetical protein